MCFLIVPTDDSKLRRLTSSYHYIKRLLSSHNKKYISFYGKHIPRREIEKALVRSQRQKGHIIYYGHGCKYGGRLYGDKRWPLFDAKNIHLFSDKIAYVAACHSARNLGRKAVKAGCRAYLGYNDLLWIPTLDQRSYGLISCINEGVAQITVKGASVNKAWTTVFFKYQTAELRAIEYKDLTAAIFINMNKRALTLLRNQRFLN